MFISGEVLTASKLEDNNNKNQVSGYCGLDGNILIPFTRFSPFSYWNAAWSDKIIVQGNWSQSNATGTLSDIDLTGSNTNIICNLSLTNLDEIKWSNLKLFAGTYNIKITYQQITIGGILEVLHGNNIIGTQDTNIGTGFDHLVTFIYVLTSNRTADFRIRVNGKTGSLYIIYIQKIEIVRMS